MKNSILLLVIALTMSFNVFAQDADVSEEVINTSLSPPLPPQDNKFSIGLGPELNMNTPDIFAGGVHLSLDFSFSTFLAAGLFFAGSYNFVDTTAIEIGGLVRSYLPGKDHLGLFAQIDFGTTLILYNDEMTPAPMGGLRAGYRFGIGTGSYVEPFFRFGYPYFIGVGAIAGMRIDTKSMSPEEKEAQRAAKAEAAEARRIEREAAAEARRIEREAAAEARLAARAGSAEADTDASDNSNEDNE